MLTSFSSLVRSTDWLCQYSSLVTVSFMSLNGFVKPVVQTSFLPPVKTHMSLAQGFTQLGAGLAVGLAGLAAGFAVGIVGDAGVRGTAQQPRLFVGMVCFFCY